MITVGPNGNQERRPVGTVEKKNGRLLLVSTPAALGEVIFTYAYELMMFILCR
jgi:hypothetical protein